MNPEEDFETWRLVVTTVTDDISSFGEVLPDLQRLMNSIEQTNLLPGELSIYTDCFIEETFPQLVESLLELALPLVKTEDNTEDVSIIDVFFKSAIMLCISKVVFDLPQKPITESQMLDEYKKLSASTINLIQILSKIFEKIELDNIRLFTTEKFLDAKLLNYFYDAKGIDKCYLIVDNINHQLDQVCPDNNTKSEKNNSDIDFEVIFESECKKFYSLLSIIQKVINGTIFILKKVSQNSDDTTNEKTEKEKIIKYYDIMHTFLSKTMPIFQKIVSHDIRKFDTNHLNHFFQIIGNSQEIDFPVSDTDKFPLTYNLYDPSISSILSTFLKSSFFDKHLYALKSFSTLCDKLESHYQNNHDYFLLPPDKRQGRHLLVSFTDKDALFKSITANFEQIQSLNFNKEFGDPLGTIYAFIMQNSGNIITNDFIKKLWSDIQFIHAADQPSFYMMIEKVIKEMNGKDKYEIVDFILNHISSSSKQLCINLLEFLYNVAMNLKSKEFKQPFLKIRDLFWSVSFDETETKQEFDIKEFAMKKLIGLCYIYSNEIIDQIVTEKLPKVQKEESDEKDKEFIIELLLNSFNKQEEISSDICNQIVTFCSSNPNVKKALDVITKICQTQKVQLSKDQIHQISKVSNKFVVNILRSSNLDDKEIEMFFYSSNNINFDLYEIILQYVQEKNPEWKNMEFDYLSYLPFQKEDLLWTFALKKSDVQKKFIKQLCHIYSNNNGTTLTDKQMITDFLNHIEKAIEDSENRESCFLLLNKFIKVVDKTNPNLADIKKHDMNFEDNFIEITIQGIERKFFFSKKSTALVVYYEAAKYLNVPIEKLTLIYSASPLPLRQKLSIFNRIIHIEFRPVVEEKPYIIIQHVRSISPLTMIGHSSLMNKFISLLLEDKNDKNDILLTNLLSDLPTYEPIYTMFNHFYIMKKINYECLFPIDHPKFFIYSLNCLTQMSPNINEELIRTNGIEYLINAMTRVNSMCLIVEIIDYLLQVLTKNELIEKYSNQLFEALMRITMFLTDFSYDKCLRLMRKLKPNNIPRFDPQFKITFAEPKKPEKERPLPTFDDDAYNFFKDMADADVYYDQMIHDEVIRENHMREMFLIRERYANTRPNNKTIKEDQFVQIDSAIPFSHVLSTVIAMTISKKKVIINDSTEINPDKNMKYLKDVVKDVLGKLPIHFEYFESCFQYLTTSDYTDFISIFTPHAKLLTTSSMQFILDNLDVKSTKLPFIIDFILLVIDDIKDEEKSGKIFTFIMDNFFTLDRDALISDAIFKKALNIASKAPSEMILNKIKEIGIPEFDQYNIDGSDYKQGGNPTGLKNLGCTCYFNSILQQFYYCPLLRKTLIEYKGNDPLFKELGNLFTQMKNRSLKFVSPQKVVDNWTGWDGEKLNPRVQQDASEFTIMMIDKLASIIPNSMFNGKLLFKTEGINNEEGKFYAERNEPFSVLILPIERLNSVEECLAAFNRPSFFTEKNQYYSDTLKRKIDAKQSDFVQELPDHLILQLKRFEYDYTSGTRKKVNSLVSISENIDISSICQFKEDSDKKCTKYHLTGIIQHMGSAMGGHYYSFVMDRENKTWYKCNDTDVQPTTIEEVLEKANSYEANAYLLFYDRDDVNEIEEIKIEQKEEEEKQQKNSLLNKYYNFYMTTAFAEFMDSISKRPELQEITAKLIIKVLSHGNIRIEDSYFTSLKTRLQNDKEFASLIQDQITDFKFFIFNKSDQINYNIFQNVTRPMLENSIQLRLIQLGVDTIDFAFEMLLDSFYFFRILTFIVNSAIKHKSELPKDEKKKVDQLLQIISDKILFILKDGINEYIKNHKEFSPNYIRSGIILSVFVKFFNLFETIPDEYIQMLQDPEFVRSFYLSKTPSSRVFMQNYIRARDLNLFDVNSFLLSYFEKESLHISLECLFESIYTVFKEETFNIFPKLKLRLHGELVSKNDFPLIYPALSEDEDTKMILVNNLNAWLPNILLHDARAVGTSSPLLQNSANFNPRDMMSPTFDAKLFGIDPEKDYESQRVYYNTVQCIYGCFDELKALISNDDYSTCLSFPILKYRALQTLTMLRGIIKLFKINFTDEFFTIDYAPLIDFGQFLVTTGHYHPFDQQIVLILKSLKENCPEELLLGTIPSKDIMMSPEKLRKIPVVHFQKYMKILGKIIDFKLKSGFTFSEDFYSKLFMMIVFNLSNMNSIVTKEKLLEIMKKILKPICDNEKASSKAFLNYFDYNAQYCITNGFISSIIGLSYLQTKRHFAQYIHPNIIDSISINSPTFYRDVILSSGQPNTNDICYDTLFNDISSITKYLCNKGNVNDKEYENCRIAIWNYLINNTRKRINECPIDKQFELQNQLFTEFSNSYNFTFFSLLFDYQEKQKEIQSIVQLIMQFIPKSQNDNLERKILDHLVFFSKHSFNALNQAFEILIQKVPEKLKESEFISDTLSNDILAQHWETVEKLCRLGFEDKTKDEIISILRNSGVAARLVQDLNILNFIYENGIIGNRFKLEDEELLSFTIVPFELMMKYKDCFEVINNDENKQIKEKSSSLLPKLQKCEINCATKDKLIDTIAQFIS